MSIKGPGLAALGAFNCGGPGTFFEQENQIKLQQIIDGTVNTILFVAAAKSVPWTKPKDLPYDAKKPLPKLGHMFPGAFLFATVDGFISQRPTRCRRENHAAGHHVPSRTSAPLADPKTKSRMVVKNDHEAEYKATQAKAQIPKYAKRRK